MKKEFLMNVFAAALVAITFPLIVNAGPLISALETEYNQLPPNVDGAKGGSYGFSSNSRFGSFDTTCVITNSTQPNGFSKIIYWAAMEYSPNEIPTVNGPQKFGYISSFVGNSVFEEVVKELGLPSPFVFSDWRLTEKGPDAPWQLQLGGNEVRIPSNNFIYVRRGEEFSYDGNRPFWIGKVVSTTQAQASYFKCSSPQTVISTCGESGSIQERISDCNLTYSENSKALWSLVNKKSNSLTVWLNHSTNTLFTSLIGSDAAYTLADKSVSICKKVMDKNFDGIISAGRWTIPSYADRVKNDKGVRNVLDLTEEALTGSPDQLENMDISFRCKRNL